MANPHDHPTALKDLQNSIYRDKVLRARGMTIQEKIDSVFELSDFQFGMMLAGAMHRLGTSDEAEGWSEVRCGLERISYVRDWDFFTTESRPQT
jgi:hypothetical protein